MPKRGGRLGRRILKWLLTLAAFFFVIAGSVLWIAWEHRVTLLERSLAQLLPGLEPKLGSLNLALPQFDLADIRLSTKDGRQEPIASINSLSLTLGSYSLSDRHIKQLHIDGVRFCVREGDLASLLPAKNASETSATTLPSLTIDSLRLTNLHLDLPADGMLPAVRFDSEIHLHEGVVDHRGQPSFQRLEVHLSNGKFSPFDGAAIEFADLFIAASMDAKSGILRIERIRWNDTEVSISQSFPTASTQSSAPAARGAMPSWLVGIDLVEAAFERIALHLNSEPSAKTSPTWSGSGELNASLRNLSWRRNALNLITSAETQKFFLQNVQFEREGPNTSLTATAVDLHVQPDAWFKNQQIDQLRLKQPSLKWEIDNTTEAISAAQTQPPSKVQNPIPLETQSLPSIGIKQAEIIDGSIEIIRTHGEPFILQSTVALAPDNKGTTASEAHHLILTDTRLVSPSQPHLPLATLDQVAVTLQPISFLTTRRIDHLQMTGGQIEAGARLLALIPRDSSSSESPASTAEAAPASGPSWVTGGIHVSDLGISLQRLAPGLPPFRFDLNFTSGETPLSAEHLVENIEPQRVELNGLTIPSTYGGAMQPVARLNSIFIHFTLDGLLAQRIDKVEIISPTVYVGEPLFWYIDYYRQYAAGKTESNAKDVALVSTDRNIAMGAVSGSSVVSSPGWSVSALQVEGGKLVLAPKGIPLPGFHQPFPFSFSTQIDSGRFDAVFDIPADDYSLPDLKLEFRGMRGHVNFNLPIRNLDNNLTETFLVDQIRWKQLHVENAHMSVTYDMNGIYAKFGGEAYEGYINGAFDVYIDDSYTWDGWIAASSVRSTEITEKMFPSYFLMDGKINGKIEAVGDSKELYQADLSFMNETPGKFSILALNSMIEDLPPDLQSSLTSQITRIGVETLRDFEYEEVNCKGRLHGREGNGFLTFKGPYGSRNFEINVFDHRWKVDPPRAPEDSNPLPTSDE